MLEVLPIKSIREEDAILIGKNLYNLALLSNHDYPVPQGFVVVPPEFKLKTALEHFQFKEKEVFEQSLHIVRSEVLKIPVPESLKKAFVKSSLDSKKLWLNLLEDWLQEIRSRIWREGFSPNLTKNLTAHPIFIIGKIKSSGSAHFDYDLKKLVIETKSALDDKKTQIISDLVQKANKLLFLPQTYQWIVESSGKTEKLYIVKLQPFTQYPEKISDSTKTVTSPKLKFSAKDHSSIKVFLEMENNLRFSDEINGCLIRSELIDEFDNKVLQLVEAASSSLDAPVIYKLYDRRDTFGGLGGALRLTHDKKLLKKDADVILFARNKKQRLNVQVALPFARTVPEVLQLKRDLASYGITRKGSLKIWQVLCVPENIVNIKHYMEAGIDGVIFQLDELASWIGGYDPMHPENYYYKNEVEAMLVFLEEAVKLIHREQIPIIISGDLALHDDVLLFFIKRGLYGVIARGANTVSLHEHLKFLERRHVK